MDLALFATGVAIGLSVTAPLGPVNVIVIRTALHRSLWVAFVVGAGAVAADLTLAVVAAFGVRSVERFIIGYAPHLTLLAGLVLAFMGIRMARSHISLAAVEAQEPPTRRQVLHKVLATFALTITNPGSLFGFLAIFSTMSAILRLGAAPYRPLIAVTGVAAGALLWWLFLSFIVCKLKARISAAFFDRINRWTGILIAAFGFALLMDAVF